MSLKCIKSCNYDKNDYTLISQSGEAPNIESDVIG